MRAIIFSSLLILSASPPMQLAFSYIIQNFYQNVKTKSPPTGFLLPGAFSETQHLVCGKRSRFPFKFLSFAALLPCAALVRRSAAVCG